MAVDLRKEIYWRLPVPFFSWIGIDVIHHFRYILLGQLIHRLPFWQDIADETVVLLTVGLLIAVPWVAIKYLALDFASAKVCFNPYRVSELGSPVRQNDLEKFLKQLISQLFPSILLLFGIEW